MDYKVKTVDEDVINAYINRDIQPVQESFFLKRKELSYLNISDLRNQRYIWNMEPMIQ